MILAVTDPAVLENSLSFAISALPAVTGLPASTAILSDSYGVVIAARTGLTLHYCCSSIPEISLVLALQEPNPAPTCLP